jgi:hypothetical protein
VVAVVEEEADVDGSSGNRQSAASTAAAAIDRVEGSKDLESSGDLESFGIKSKMTRGGLLFIGSKISAAILI